MQRPNAGLGTADGKLRLGRMAALAGGHAQGGEEDQDQPTPKEGTATDGGEDPRDEQDYGVFPVRWSSIRAARARRA